MNTKIFIPFNTPSSKNTKVMTRRGIFHSATTKKYLQKLGIIRYSPKGYKNYSTRPNLFLSAVLPLKNALSNQAPPHVVGFHFIRDTRHKFDIINAMQIISDLLVAHDVIPDDNADCLIPVPICANGQWYTYDKENPGVLLIALNEKNLQELKFSVDH